MRVGPRAIRGLSVAGIGLAAFGIAFGVAASQDADPGSGDVPAVTIATVAAREAALPSLEAVGALPALRRRPPAPAAATATTPEAVTPSPTPTPPAPTPRAPVAPAPTPPAAPSPAPAPDEGFEDFR